MLLVTSLLLGAIWRLLWGAPGKPPDYAISSAVRVAVHDLLPVDSAATARWMLIGIVVALAVTGGLAEYLEIREVATALERVVTLLAGAIVGFLAVNLLLSSAPGHPLIASAVIGIAVLGLAATQIFTAEDLRRNLRTIDTPWLKIELNVIESPKTDKQSLAVRFFQSDVLATDAAEAAAHGVANMVGRSESWAEAAAYLTETDRSEFRIYASDDEAILFEKVIKPTAECIAAIYRASPGDERNFLISEDFRSKIYSEFRHRIEILAPSDQKNERASKIFINQDDIIDEIREVDRIYEHYIFSGRIASDNSNDVCENLLEIMILSIQDFDNIRFSIDTYHLPFLLAGFFTARDRSGEATDELLAWLTAVALPRMHLLLRENIKAPEDLHFVLTVLETTHWLARYYEQSENHAAVEELRWVVLEIIERIAQDFPRASTMLDAAFDDADMPFTLDGRCPIGAALGDEVGDWATWPKLLPVFLLVNVNNLLYQKWAEQDQQDPGELEAFTARFLPHLAAYDYDCFPSVGDPRSPKANLTVLKFAETLVTIELNRIASMDPREADPIRVAVCNLAFIAGPIAEMAENLPRQISPPGHSTATDSSVLEAATEGQILEHLERRKKERDTHQVANLIRHRMEQITGLLRGFAVDERLAFETARKKACDDV